MKRRVKLVEGWVVISKGRRKGRVYPTTKAAAKANPKAVCFEHIKERKKS